MKKKVLIIIILTILSKFTGFIRDIVLSFFYGASSISDAYLISLTIPNEVFAYIGVSIATALIPIYTEIQGEKGNKKANNYINNMVSIVLLISTILVVFGFIFTKGLIKIFALGFEGDVLDLAVNFTRVSIISIYFIGLIKIFVSYLQMYNKFFITTIIAIPMNLILIFSIYMSHKYNIYILAIGNLIGIVIQFIVLVPSIKKVGYRYKPTVKMWDQYIKRMLFASIPVMLGESVNQINVIFDKTMASLIQPGGISILNYAYRISQIVQGIFIVSIVTVLYPTISKMASENKLSQMKTHITEAIGLISLFTIPMSIGIIIFSNPIVRLIYGRGVFSQESIEITALTLIFYSFGMIGFGFREVLSKTFFSLQDTKTPMVNAIYGLVINIILNIVLSRFWGISGLALATSISAIFTTFLMFVSLRKKIGPFGMKQISISFLKILFASLVMGLFAKLSFNYLTSSLSQNLSLLIAIGVGAISYFVIIYFMKIEDIDVIVGAIKKKLGRRVD